MPENMMGLSDDLRDRVRELLRPVNPAKVIVFGSYAHGEAGPDI